jgi:undecaprenyl-diphosphatase
MPIEQIFILSFVQGLTEFFPVSSSMHLNIVHLMSNWDDQGPLMDLSLHVGSLCAVIVCLKKNILSLSVKNNSSKIDSISTYKYFYIILIASIPTLIIGFILVKTGYIHKLRDNLELIGWVNLIFALLLLLSDRNYFHKNENIIKSKHFFIIGLFQILSLIPGVSRSGICYTTSRAMGLNRIVSAKIAIVMSLPIILSAGLYMATKLMQTNDMVFIFHIILALLLSFLFSLYSIRIILSIIEKFNVIPFVIYRIAISLVIFYTIYT